VKTRNKKSNHPYFPLEIMAGAVRAVSRVQTGVRKSSGAGHHVGEPRRVACNVAGSQVGETRVRNEGQRSHDRDDSPEASIRR
jgi:hypothetical protein